MAQPDLVSVIIPCYNYGAYVADTIVSLQSQTYENWEAIVVDDGSKDDTGSRVLGLAQNDARIFYVHQKNQGVSVARNTGMAMARGEFISFLDADDLITPSKLRAHVEHFWRCPSVDISFSSLRYFLDGNPGKLFTNYKLDSVRDRNCTISGCGREIFPAFIQQNNLPLQAAMFRRALLQRVGDFDSDMRALEDWDYVLRSILRGACIAGVDDPVAMAMVRVHPGSATPNIAFSDYMDRVYRNVSAEIELLRDSDREEDARFYSECLHKMLSERAQRQKKRLLKERRAEVRDRILNSGLANFSELSSVVREFGGVGFLRAYVGALIKYLSTWRLF